MLSENGVTAAVTAALEPVTHEQRDELEATRDALRDLSSAAQRVTWLVANKGIHYRKTIDAFGDLQSAQRTADELLIQAENQ